MTRLMEGIRSLIEQSPDAQLLAWDPEYMEPIR